MQILFFSNGRILKSEVQDRASTGKNTESLNLKCSIFSDKFSLEKGMF